MNPARGEVWLFDLGVEGKVRPALVVIVPNTTSLRRSQFEIVVRTTFLKPGAFLVQNVATYPNIRAIRKLGKLQRDQFDLVFFGLLRWLGHSAQ
jgi:mRNA interferase MazF